VRSIAPPHSTIPPAVCLPFYQRGAQRMSEHRRPAQRRSSGRIRRFARATRASIMPGENTFCAQPLADPASQPTILRARLKHERNGWNPPLPASGFTDSHSSALADLRYRRDPLGAAAFLLPHPRIRCTLIEDRRRSPRGRAVRLLYEGVRRRQSEARSPDRAFFCRRGRSPARSARQGRAPWVGRPIGTSHRSPGGRCAFCPRSDSCS
jgi:hypothetical protein